MAKIVGDLEAALFSAFPREDAEDWDQPGLAVGDRTAPVKKIAVNLDMTTAAVEAAADAGCDVLVTHHPPFIKGGPTEFGPATSAVTPGPGRMIYAAARAGISVIAMHTNADRAVAVRTCYADLLGYDCEGNFEHLQDPMRDADGTGLGALLSSKSPQTLGDLAQRCQDAFGGAPRVWGDPERAADHVAFLNGCWTEPELYGICVENGIDCLIVGETRYHIGTDAAPHLSLIDLGHDKSELPIVEVLAETLVDAGYPADSIVRIGTSENNWWIPR